MNHRKTRVHMTLAQKNWWKRGRTGGYDRDRAVFRAERLKCAVLTYQFIAQSGDWVSMVDIADYIGTIRTAGTKATIMRYTRRLTYGLVEAGLLELKCSPVIGTPGKLRAAKK